MLKVELEVKTRSVTPPTPKALGRAARYMVSQTQKRISGTSAPPNAPLTVAVKGSSKPLRDTGQLLASITSRVEGDRAIIGTNRQGARLNQEGGVIRPVKAKKLWIPADRWCRKQLRASGGSISRLIERLKSRGSCWKARSGKAFLFKPRGKGGRTRVLFVLRDSVTIPSRPFLYFSEEDGERIAKMLMEDMTGGSQNGS